MGDESDIAELRRRVSLIEQDVDGERNVSREMDDRLTGVAKSVAAVMREELAKRK
jgi:hypothetical protein